MQDELELAPRRQIMTYLMKNKTPLDSFNQEKDPLLNTGCKTELHSKNKWTNSFACQHSLEINEDKWLKLPAALSWGFPETESTRSEEEISGPSRRGEDLLDGASDAAFIVSPSGLVSSPLHTQQPDGRLTLNPVSHECASEEMHGGRNTHLLPLCSQKRSAEIALSPHTHTHTLACLWIAMPYASLRSPTKLTFIYRFVQNSCSIILK